jgi:FMN-dependent NADH-azoreductase
MTRILHIDASARQTDSRSRSLSADIVRRLHAADVTRRDLAKGIPLIDEAWVGATFTPADHRTAEQRAVLGFSDTLVDEVVAADTIVIGTPIYNFAVPAALKAWIDQVARVGRTFNYTAYGPVGLLEGKRAIVAIASGGTEVGSDIDHATGYLRHVLGFIGIDDVTFVTADTLDETLLARSAA